MNPVILVALPLAVTPTLILLQHRGTLATGLSAATSLLWSALCLITPLAPAVEFLGRTIALSQLDRLALALLGFDAVFLTLTGWTSERENALAPSVLLMLGTTAAVFMSTHLGVAAVLLSLAAVIAVFTITGYGKAFTMIRRVKAFSMTSPGEDGMVGSDPDLAQLMPGYLALMVIAALLLVAAAWLSDLMTPQTSVSTGMQPIVILVTVGLAIFLAVPPFHTWWVVMVRNGSETLAAFLGTMFPLVGLLLLMEFLQANPWATAGASLARSLTAAGLLAGGVGAALAAGASDRRRWLAYATIAETGCILAGLGTMTLTGAAGAVLLLLNHGLALALITACRVAGPSLDRGSSLVKSGWTVGGLSLSGIPLTAGFVGRWLIYLPLSQQSVVYTAILILSSFGLFVGYLRVWRGIVVQAGTLESRGRSILLRLLVGASTLALLAWGVLPHLILSNIVEVLKALAFLSP